MLSFSDCSILEIANSLVGNQSRYEGVSEAKKTIKPSFVVEEIIVKMIAKTFEGMDREMQFHKDRHQVGDWIGSIFSDNEIDLKLFKRLSDSLYDASSHNTRFKQGEFLGVLLENVSYGGEFLAPTLALIKVQEKSTFLKIENNDANSVVVPEFGINGKIEIGAIVLPIGDNNIVFSIDTITKSGDLSFWEEYFLRLEPIQNDYFYTNHWMIIASEFIKSTLKFSLSQPQTVVIECLNRAGVYFKEQTDFHEEQFAKFIFQNIEGLDFEAAEELLYQKSEEYVNQYSVELLDTFALSNQAVKEKLKIFKSTIKLDTNFKIDVASTRSDLIENGFDEKTGKKYYKIFYDQEA
jgi:hypothetical protein